jgi:multidrug efflux pump subunit AcrA (membrane-fusion protein)
MRPFTGIIALVLAAGVPACGGGERQADVEAPQPIAVAAAATVAIETTERLEAGGVVAAQESASVSSRIVATVTSVRIKAGDRVRAGDVLVTLDARDVAEHTRQVRASATAAEKSVAQAHAAQSAAEAEHRLAVAWRDRVAALHARNSATDQERDEAEARLAAAAARLAGARAGIEGADAELAAARAAIGAAEVNESFATVLAPFNGLVTERMVDPGNLAAPGIPLVRMESDGRRQVVVRVDESRVGFIQPGDRVDVLIDGARPAAHETGLQGIVAEVARAVAADQRAFTVKITLPIGTTWRSGSFARVLFRGAPRRALVIPASAIQQHGQVSSVYVVQDGIARLRLVHVGPASADGIEVLAGLDEGELVVTSPLVRLVDGARVTTTGTSARTGDTP